MMPLQATLRPLTDLTALETIWRDLESRADRAFFLSWTWIGSWLETFADAPTLFTDFFTGQAAPVAYATVGILTLTTFTLGGFNTIEMVGAIDVAQ